MSRCSASMSDSKENRIVWVDVWRFCAVVGMVVYHALYDLALFGFADEDLSYALPMLVLRSAVGGSFVLLAGVSCRLTKNNLRRGVITLAAGVLVMLAGLIVGMPVMFGILQLLGLCMVLYAFFGEKIARWRGIGVPVFYIAAFALTLWLTKSISVNVPWLYPLGFITEDFYSADFYPLLPWAFLFLFGTWLGGKAAPRGQYRLPRFASFCARHSLVIYLVHQPVLYGLCMIAARVG